MAEAAASPGDKALGWAPAVATFAVGTCAGLAYSARPSIWYDESATLSAVHRPLDEIVRLVSHVDVVHATYYVSAWAWSQVTGDGIVALRALSALGLGATAGAVFLLADHLLSRRAALIAGVAAAVLPGLAWSGLEARSYAWSAALSVLSTYALVLALEKKGSIRWVRYGALMTLMVWWSCFAALMLVVHGVAIVVNERRLPRPWLLACATTTLACVPLAVLAHTQSSQVGWIEQSRLQVLRGVVFGQVLEGQRFNAPGLAPVELAAALLGLVIAYVTTAWLRSGDAVGQAPTLRLLLVWAILPTLLVAGANLLGAQVYQPRYLIFCAPAVAIVVGAGGAALPPRRAALCGVLAVLLVVPILTSLRAQEAKSGDDYLRLAGVASEAHADLVVFDRADLRGIAIAYPAMFRATRDVSMARAPRISESLWGRNVRPRRLDREVVAGRRVVLYLLRAPAHRRFGRRLRKLGCTPAAGITPVRTARAEAVVLQC